MDTLAFDGRMGASGDMILAALLDAGGDPDVLAPVEDALGVEYVVGRTTTGGIDAANVDVRYADNAETQRHEHEHGAEHGHDHHHDHATDEHAAEGHGPTRRYDEVIDVVERMALPDAVEERALAIFERLGNAESAVHGTDLDATHFHEVGADDAIADVVGASLLFADLDPDRIVTTPLSTGDGEVEMAHGTTTVPAPAVVEIAADADYSIQGGPVERELLTPTGAAILAEVADGVETLPTMDVRASGYGAGDHETGDRANALRVLLGETAGDLRRESITVLETNVDDVSPEMLGGLQETLTEAGARDVSILPVTMKKSRPGHLIKVVVKPEDADRVARRLAEETGTLGVREHGAGHRWVAERETRTVDIELDAETYPVDVKVASDREGTWLDASAEYEDALAVARETDRPVREIMARAERALDE
ncbi:nickel pincer cofactor biosynthesis protein LarC [Halorhabdus sp. BNX81]|uniref:nickel pincer cofactor biosynthesis protein LarC n=1 Tax=Halorhabdus sp. BNX81 TaxID=2980181 RepID=UPI0023DD0324|nr:nickel pincer cofactor biosynthesis protein LarC [Halorhabdus sp. BNX81]WEL20774.1 Pyridinium-3,5-bisthiocarboxylic acid mononucleotide nickel chelatase [Halorhabdus sp. BNX81]